MKKGLVLKVAAAGAASSLIAAFGWRVVAAVEAKTRDAPAEVGEVPVVTALVTRRDTREGVSFTGVIRPRSEVDIVSKVSGRIEQLAVSVGDSVTVGGLLAVVEHRESEWQNRQAGAQARAAAAALEQTRNNLETTTVEQQRFEALQKVDAVSQAELDRVESLLRSTRAAVRVAEAQLAIAQAAAGLASESLRNSRITSPVAGTIIKRQVNVGTYVTPGQALFNVQDASTLKLDGTVNAEDFARMRVGQDVAVSVEDLPGTTFAGKIATLSPSLSPQTRRAAVEVALSNAERRLLPNMFASARVEVGIESRALVVPTAAVLTIDSQRAVYVLREGKVRLVHPQLGSRDGELIRINSGLVEGDEVIVSGQTGLADGRAVLVAKRQEQEVGRP